MTVVNSNSSKARRPRRTEILSNRINSLFFREAKKHLSLISLYQVSLEATAKGALFVDFPEVQDE